MRNAGDLPLLRILVTVLRALAVLEAALCWRTVGLLVWLLIWLLLWLLVAVVAGCGTLLLRWLSVPGLLIVLWRLVGRWRTVAGSGGVVLALRVLGVLLVVLVVWV